MTDGTVTTNHRFGDYKLKKTLLRGIIEKGFKNPLEIQKRAMKNILNDQNVVAIYPQNIFRRETFIIPCLEKVGVNVEAIQG